ncbi:hypothetical protein G7046_g1578 [Stylonectria norvegica]|nr:hypothetical protein G7046_g1578 [Stylonectria norvegica]
MTLSGRVEILSSAPWLQSPTTSGKFCRFPLRCGRTVLTRPADRFNFLAHNFNYKSRILSLGTKVVVNQLVFTPTFNTFFFGSQALMSGETVHATIERIKMTVPVSFVNAMKLWPAVTAFSFTFVPIEYRPIFAGFVAVGWQTYLSYLNRQAEIRGALLAVSEQEKFEYNDRQVAA